MSNQNSKSTNNKKSLKTNRRLRSISVPRTTFEIKQYNLTGVLIQRSRIGTNRLRRRDIITNNHKSSNSSTYNPSSHTKNTKNSKLFSYQKSKLIKKFQKYSKKIEDKFRKKYNRYKNTNTNRNNPKNTFINSDSLSYDDNISCSPSIYQTPVSQHKHKKRSKKQTKMSKTRGNVEKKDECSKSTQRLYNYNNIQLRIADVCYDFQNHGKCKRGDACRYQHVLACKSLCLDWKNGHCPRGDVCRFAHRYGNDIIQPKINKIVSKNGNNNENIHKNNHKNISVENRTSNGNGKITVNTVANVTANVAVPRVKINTNVNGKVTVKPRAIPQIIRNNILIRNNVSRFGNGRTLVIPRRNVGTPLPKIIHSRIHRNIPTRRPIAVIVRNTNKENIGMNINRVRNRVQIINNNGNKTVYNHYNQFNQNQINVNIRTAPQPQPQPQPQRRHFNHNHIETVNVNMNKSTSLSPSPLMPYVQQTYNNHTSQIQSQVQSQPRAKYTHNIFTPIRTNHNNISHDTIDSPITPKYNDDINNSNGNNDDDEFDFEKLGNQIQSSIQREEAIRNEKKMNSNKNHKMYTHNRSHSRAPTPYLYKLQPQPPTHNYYRTNQRRHSQHPMYPTPPMQNTNYKCKYKYKYNSSSTNTYLYHQERNNNINNNNNNKYLRNNYNKK